MIGETAILLPIYKENPSKEDLLRIRCTYNSNKVNPILVLHPTSLEISKYQKVMKQADFIPWHDEGFKTRNHYNQMMLSAEFWSLIETLCENVVLCQTDAFLIRNIVDLTELGKCYIGASWNPPYVISRVGNHLLMNRRFLSRWPFNINLEVGNGGLSYRSVKFMHEMIEEMKKSSYWQSLVALDNRKMNEDLAFSLFGALHGKPIAEKMLADRIFIETAAFTVEDIDHLYGFHALSRRHPELELDILKRFLN